MIRVDETDPVGDLEQCFEPRDVLIKRGKDAKEWYEMVTEIGRGKFGTVFRCREKSTGLQLAAKFVPIPKREDRRNVEREVELMNALQHSLIIQLYDAFEYQKMMCVVLELVEGGELFDRVIDDDFVLTERACSVFVRQVCQAMEFVHRNNIIHLDLKPENILCLTREGNRIKIIDFGLARKFDPDKKLQVLFGTPEFVAPEVVNFDQISFGTDMWSVGVICYVLLSGLSPFMGGTDVETMANVTIGKYDFDDEAFAAVSKDALDFIGKLLVKDSSTRLTAAQCLTHKWLKQRRLSTKTKSAKQKAAATAAAAAATAAAASTDSAADIIAGASATASASATPSATASEADGQQTSAPPSPQTVRRKSSLGDPLDVAVDTIATVTTDNGGQIGPSSSCSSDTNNNNLTAAPVQDCAIPCSPAATSCDIVDPQTASPSAAAASDQPESSAELRASKDNLKSFIERWEEQPKSPYAFDAANRTIEPVPEPEISIPVDARCNGVEAAAGREAEAEELADSLLSSRGCSPSPCDSSASDPLPNSLDDPLTSPARPPLPSTQPPQLHNAPNSGRPPHPTDTGALDSGQPHKLQQSPSFGRRHSNPDICEATDQLADEIKRLSQRLQRLSSSLAIDQNGSRHEEEGVGKLVRQVSPDKPALKPKPEYLRNKTRTSMDEHFARQLAANTEEVVTSRRAIQRKATATSSNGHSTMTTSTMQTTTTTTASDRRFIRASSVMNTSCTSGSATSSQSPAFTQLRSDRLSARLQLLDDMPSLSPQSAERRHLAAMASVESQCESTAAFYGQSLDWSQRNSAQHQSLHNSGTRRTKFRVSHLSRDVPYGVPDVHRPIFLEEAVSTTKDCLLHLLDKHGGTGSDQRGRLATSTERRSAFQRHREYLAQAGVGTEEDAEVDAVPVEQQQQQLEEKQQQQQQQQRSANSLSIFFQRHAGAGRSVRQIQAQLESKRQF